MDKIKIFREHSAEDVEIKANEWLESNKEIEVTNTTFTEYNGGFTLVFGYQKREVEEIKEIGEEK